MGFVEKTHWVILVVSAITVVAYVAMILPPAMTGPISKVGYEQPLLVAIAVFVGANVLGNVLCAASNPAEYDRRDQRDRDIDHFGDRVGNSLLIAGSCLALALALTKQDYFWIANSLFFAGLIGGSVGAMTKVAAYHGPFQRW